MTQTKLARQLLKLATDALEEVAADDAEIEDEAPKDPDDQGGEVLAESDGKIASEQLFKEEDFDKLAELLDPSKRRYSDVRQGVTRSLLAIKMASMHKASCSGSKKRKTKKKGKRVKKAAEGDTAASNTSASAATAATKGAAGASTPTPSSFQNFVGQQSAALKKPMSNHWNIMSGVDMLSGGMQQLGQMGGRFGRLITGAMGLPSPNTKPSSVFWDWRGGQQKQGPPAAGPGISATAPGNSLGHINAMFSRLRQSPGGSYPRGEGANGAFQDVDRARRAAQNVYKLHPKLRGVPAGDIDVTNMAQYGNSLYKNVSNQAPPAQPELEYLQD